MQGVIDKDSVQKRRTKKIWNFLQASAFCYNIITEMHY